MVNTSNHKEKVRKLDFIWNFIVDFTGLSIVPYIWKEMFFIAMEIGISTVQPLFVFFTTCFICGFILTTFKWYEFFMKHFANTRVVKSICNFFNKLSIT